MNNSDQEMPEKMRLYERYSSYPDAQILEILKNHLNYQEAGVEAAVKIAVERQLINSEQDLFGPEFQNVKSLAYTLFPEVSDSYHRHKLEGSIFRFLYVMSFMPVIYGFLQYGKGHLDQTILGAGIGLFWFLLCWLLNKTRKLIVWILLFLLLLIVLTVVGLKVFGAGLLNSLDLVIYGLSLLLPSYLLLYLKKLIRQDQESI